jgi:preprotein translocase subunit YajC
MNGIGYFIISLVILFAGYIALSLVNMKKQQKKLLEVQTEIQVGRKVIISGGIHGVIKHLTDQTALIEVANGVTLNVERYALMNIRK